MITKSVPFELQESRVPLVGVTVIEGSHFIKCIVKGTEVLDGI